MENIIEQIISVASEPEEWLQVEREKGITYLYTKDVQISVNPFNPASVHMTVVYKNASMHMTIGKAQARKLGEILNNI